MLSRNSYPKAYVEESRAKVDADSAAFKKLATAARKQAADATKLAPAITAFEPVFFNNLVLVLENLFVHRGRGIEGKDGNPLNKVRVLASSLLEHGGVMTPEKSIKLRAEDSVLGYEAGDEIRLNAADFARLSAAFFDELEAKFT
jgi:hypothetical protein